MTRSPFPGMDPYLERHWSDVHTKLIAHTADILNEQLLPPDLAASTQERVAVEGDKEVEKQYYPDVRLIEPDGRGGVAVKAAPTDYLSAGLTIRLIAQVDPIIERYIRIVNAADERTITVIEFLSPANKRAPGIVDFRAKRGELLAAGVNFVEIDLILQGNWQRLLWPHRCEDKDVTAYRATVRLPGEPAVVHLIPMPLRSPLPPLAIPLRENDPRVVLDLQPLLDRAYVTGRYGRRLKYTLPPDPPLGEADEGWVEELIRGTRPSAEKV